MAILRLEFEVPDGGLCTGCSNCNKDDGICLLFNQYLETQIFSEYIKCKKCKNSILRDYHSVQIIRDDYDIIHNSKVKEKYPNLYKEVYEHNEISRSSWYKFSKKAYDEYRKYLKDNTIGYID